MSRDNTVEIRLTANTKNFEDGMDRATRKVRDGADNMERQVGSAADRMSILSARLAGALAGIFSVGLAKGAVDVMSSFEQLEIRMRSLMGSSAEGDRAFAWITQFATDTPYEVDQVSEAFMRLKAFGLDPMDGTLKAVTDTAAKMGGGFETVSRISLALGQAWTKQKLQGEEILQLIEAGVPVWDMLAKVTGKNTVELQELSSKGQLGRDVMRQLIDEMGRVADGSAAAQMQSLNGQISNFSDNVKNALDELRKAGGLEPFKAGLTEVNGKLTELANNGQIREWAVGMSFLMDQVGRSIGAVAQAVGGVLQTLVGIVASSTDDVVKSVNNQASAMDMLAGAMKGLATFFSALGTGIEVVMLALRGVVMDVLAGLRVAWSLFSETVQVAATAIKGSIQGLIDALVMLSNVGARAMALDFDGAEAAWQAGLDRIKGRVRATADEIKAIHKQAANERADAYASSGMGGDTGRLIEEAARRGRDRLAGIWATPEIKGTDLSGGISRSNSDSNRSGDGGGSDKEKSRMRYYEDMLLAEKRLAAERDGLREYTKEQELAFWQQILASARLSAEDRANIERKVSGLVIDLKRQEARDRKALDAEATRSAEALALGEVEARRAAAQAALNAEQITKIEMAQLEQQFEQQRYDIQRTALEERLRLAELDPNMSPAELARIKNQLLELEQQHEVRRIQLHGQMAQAQREAAEESGRIWESLGDRMGGLWDKGIQAMMNGTLRWNNALRAIGAEMAGWFASEVVGAQVKTWLAGHAKMLAAKLGFIAQEQIMNAAGSAATVATKTGEATAVIYANAAEAGSGAAASLASIPIAGPALALAAMATVFAAVSGLGKGLKSASGGYDIPKGLNPLTQLHAEEMVLPAQYANVIRSLAANGGIEGGGAPAQNFHISVNALDGASVRRFLVDNRMAVADALKAAARDFKR